MTKNVNEAFDAKAQRIEDAEDEIARLNKMNAFTMDLLNDVKTILEADDTDPLTYVRKKLFLDQLQTLSALQALMGPLKQLKPIDPSAVQVSGAQEERYSVVDSSVLTASPSNFPRKPK